MPDPINSSRPAYSQYDAESQQCRLDETNQSIDSSANTDLMSVAAEDAAPEPGASQLAEAHRPSRAAYADAQAPAEQLPAEQAPAKQDACFEALEDAGGACLNALLGGYEAGQTQSPIDAAQAAIAAYNCADKVDDALVVCAD